MAQFLVSKIGPATGVRFYMRCRWASFLNHPRTLNNSLCTECTPSAQTVCRWYNSVRITRGLGEKGCSEVTAPSALLYLKHDVRAWCWKIVFWTGIPVPRVQGLPIRDCTRGCNNCVHMRAQMSTTYVTEKILFERSYLVSGMSTFGTWFNCPYAPTTSTVYTTTISRFLCIFFPERPLIFWSSRFTK